MCICAYSVFCSDQLKFETFRLGLETHRMDWRPWYGELGTVAVPILQASGSLTFDEVRLRFIVIDRLGADLDKFFKGGENPWPIHTVLRVGLMVLDSLQFVHSKGYAHNDIKVTIISVFSSPHQPHASLTDFCLFLNAFPLNTLFLKSTWHGQQFTQYLLLFRPRTCYLASRRRTKLI